MQLFLRQPLPSIRSKLFTLVLACALPILIGYIAFARDSTQREDEHVAQDARTVARVLVAAVERDLKNGETAARVLANSPMLARGELAAFHATARSLLRPDFPAHAFVLTGSDGRPLLDTHVPYGRKLHASGDARAIARVFASGDATASGLRRPAPGQPYVVSIDVPVWHKGKVIYVLSVQLRTRQLADLVANQPLPPGWIAEVFDNQGLLVARSVEPAQHIGSRMASGVARALQQHDSGIALLADADGKPGYAAFSRSSRHGWSVSINYPRDAARALLGHSLGATIAGIAALLLTSLGLAWIIGGAIARSVSQLAAPAEALGRGEPLAFAPPAIREAASVADALRKVEGELLRYRTTLETLVAERTAELQRSNAQLETVYATAPVGLCFMDRQLRVVMINEYLARFNAIPAHAHLGRTLAEVLGEAGVAFEQGYRRVLDTGRPLTDVEYSGEIPAAPGVVRHWISSYYPVFGPDRVLMGINAVVLDITDRKLQEQRNRDNEEMFRVLFEKSGDPHVLVASGAGYVSANQAAVALFGCDSIDQLLTLSPLTTSPERQPDGRDSTEAALEYMRQVLHEGSVQFEWVYRRADDTLFHADVLLTSVQIGGDGLIQGTIRDISDRVAAEMALRATGARLVERERFLRTVTDHLPALVGYWDASERCLFANRPYLALLGRDEGEVIGQSAELLLDPKERSKVAPYVRNVLAGQPQSFERELRKADGQTMHAWGNFIPDFDQSGEVRGFYMLYADVTDLKSTQSRLVQALGDAEQANRAKGRFLANMSHEIRTPMNAIMGLARLLEEAALPRRERGYVARMKMAAASLLAMLSDVLDFSRIDAGQLTLEHTAFRLDDVLSSIAVLTASNAWSKGIEPVFAIAPDVPAVLLGDPMRLEQILLNLVGNAIKFTSQGEVVLSIRAIERDRGQVLLAFSVRDTGIGIAPAQQRNLFEAFSQGDSSTSRKYGGAGLGLAIARRLVGLHGGSLSVRSSLGLGAEFTFAIRFPVLEEAPTTPPGGAAPLRVLLASANACAGAAIAETCAAYGWQVERAASGAEALALLRGARRYDLAFVDSTLPGIDGAAVLARAHRTPSIAMPRCCLMAADPDTQEPSAVKADAVLAKPVTPTALRAAIAELRGVAAPAHAAPPAQPLAARLPGLRVLLAEDNILNQEVANHILVHSGASVDIAANGQEALVMLSERAHAWDVVLMDLQMPVMNGFEAARALREAGLTLPIVAMTANATDDDRQLTLAAGMQAHLAKPIDVDELLSTLARVTGRSPPPAAPAAPGDTVTGVPLPDTLSGIDLKAALARFDGSFENFAAVLRRLEGSEGTTVDEVEALLRQDRRHEARQRVHRLRGVAANLGADEVAALALELEQAMADADTDALAPPVARLDAALEAVFAAARELGPPRAADVRATPALPVTHDTLAGLLELLQNNNMKALATFEALRPGLAALAGADATAALAEAVGTLRFEEAARLVRGILTLKEDA